jgi:hypothetical protein
MRLDETRLTEIEARQGFIALAREDVPYLLTELRKAWVENVALWQTLKANGITEVSMTFERLDEEC